MGAGSREFSRGVVVVVGCHYNRCLEAEVDNL